MARRWTVTCLLAALFVLISGRPAGAQPAVRITDVNTDQEQTDPLDWSGEILASTGTTVYFDTDDGSHGVEVWRTDGTPAGTRLIKDVCPGACGLLPEKLTFSTNGTFFFAADDGSHGIELWHSDGTEAGTRLIKDLYPGLLSGLITFAGMVDVDGTLFFIAVDGTGAVGLWASDGTTAGTRLVKALSVSAGGLPTLGAAVGGSLLFSWGSGLWASDGTEDGTTQIAEVGAALSTSLLQTSTGRLFFTGHDADHGFELWMTDGTAAGTVRVEDIVPGVDNSFPGRFQELGGLVYFSANDGEHGWELWRTDGTPEGTALVKDLWAGSDGSHPAHLTALGGLLLFRASGPAGAALWKTDGTADGTVKIRDLHFGEFWDQWPFVRSGGKVYFFTEAGFAGPEIWESDGTEAGTRRAVFFSEPIEPEPGLAVAGGRLYFHAWSEEGGVELWQSDGTSAGTGPVVGVPRFASSFLVSGGEIASGRRSFAAHGDRLAFTLFDFNRYEVWFTNSAGTTASELLDFQLVPEGFVHWNGLTLFEDIEIWRTNGTLAGGTFPLGVSGHFLTPSEDAVFFSAGELWKTDGTVAGTVEVKDLVEGGDSNPAQLTDVDGTLFFVATSEAGEELWKSDGTADGTVLIKDIVPDSGSSAPRHLTNVAGDLFFAALTDETGWELWTSDGSEDGTVLVKDIRPGPGSGFTVGFPAVAAGPLHFFVADDGTTGNELWRSDGTEAGTFRLRDIFPGALGSEPFEMVRVRNRVFFTADDGIHGRELWVSDGTVAGTFLVADLRPGAESAVPQQLEGVGHLLLFSAHDGVHGRELWKSDGTAAGTVQVQDLAPGALSSSPLNITAAGTNVYFAANDNTTGFELWSLPRAVLGSTFADVPVGFWAWRWVEALAEAGVTGGCGGSNFCPDQPVTRAQAAVFLERAAKGVAFTPPPATGTLFADVPQSFWAAAWIEQLAADGVTGGCGNGNFCPDVTLTRAQMAVFLLRMKRGPDFVPPPATGTLFADVPASFWAAAWIERLVAEGITGGCGGGNFCPDQPVTRAQMAVFLSATFDLPTP